MTHLKGKKMKKKKNTIFKATFYISYKVFKIPGGNSITATEFQKQSCY